MPIPPIDLTGQRFGDWLVLGEQQTVYSRGGIARTVWLCRCVCGTVKHVNSAHLRSGASRGCRKCVGRHIAETRGTLLSTGETRREASLRLGGCSELIESRIYRGWDEPRALRVKPNTSHAITVDGRTRPVCEWIADIGISRQAFHQRVARGMSREEAATTPPTQPTARAFRGNRRAA